MPNVDETIENVFTALPEKLTLWSVLYIILIILAAVVVSRIALWLAGRALSKSKLDISLQNLIKNVVRLAVGVVCVLLICETLGIPITSLIALFSVVGLALSLAVQGLLANLAGGMTLLWAKPFQLGDFVEVDGVIGTVREISLMYTKVATTDNKLVSIPNKIVSETKAFNFSCQSTRRVELSVSVSYDAPIEKVKSVILAELDRNPLTLAEPAPMVGVIEFGTSAIRYNVWVWCAGADYWPALYSVNEGIKAALDANGCAMTYNHVNVHMVKD